MITVCIPTLNRYDMLERLILSAEAGSIKPDKYLIVDNGGKLNFSLNTKVDLYIPPRNIGVAASWNWLIRNSSEIRFICNDDLEFFPHTVETIVNYFTDKCILFHTKFNRHNNDYSGFVISDYVFSLVGEFDESISPNYGYFEDNDYDFRIYRNFINKIDNGDTFSNYQGIPYEHKRSSTITLFNDNQLKNHHEKFKIAKDNFQRKWNMLPDDLPYE